MSTPFHSFKTITKCPFYFLFFSISKINHSLPPQEACGNKYSQDLNWKLCLGKNRATNDSNLSFSREGDGSRWRKIPTSWAMEDSTTWWSMEGEAETSFHLFPLPPQQILLKSSIFSFDLKVLFYHGFRPLPTHSLPFLDL